MKSADNSFDKHRVLGNFDKANKKLSLSLTKSAKNTANANGVFKKLRLDKNNWFSSLPKAKQYEHFQNIIGSISGNLSNETLKRSWGGVIDELTGKETPVKIADALAKQAMTDKDFLKAMKKKFEDLETKHGK